MNIRVAALAAACTTLLAACGGSDSSGGTVQSINFPRGDRPGLVRAGRSVRVSTRHDFRPRARACRTAPERPFTSLVPASLMNKIVSTGPWPDEPARRSFVHTAAGVGLAAMTGGSACAAAAKISDIGVPEPGLPFEAEYLDNARILAERLPPFGYTVDIHGKRECHSVAQGHRFVCPGPAGHLDGIAEHHRHALGRIPARRRPPAGHSTARRTACALCLIRTRHSC